MLFLIISFIQLAPFEIEVVNRVSADSEWLETDWSGLGAFENSTNIDVVSMPGVLKLLKGTYIYVTDT